MSTISTGQDVDEGTPLLRSRRKLPSSNSDAEFDFDARFKKWKAAVAQKFRRSASHKTSPLLLVTFFREVDAARGVLKRKSCDASSTEAPVMSADDFQLQIQRVEEAIVRGVLPKMITAGSSGSYFARVLDGGKPGSSTDEASDAATTVVAVFKPKDEEPYGNLNPKRQFLRKYFWWAMGRPCLIPNFSYLSEVGASYLDSRLCLHMVPRTELVELSSPSFHYAFADRKAFETESQALPAKIGSYQVFLNGYVNASDFLRKHPWPSRARSEALMLRDFDDESRAHQVSRKKQKARLRNCGIALKRLLLCRPSSAEHLAEQHEEDLERQQRHSNGSDGSYSTPDGFHWTSRRMEQFRLQLEKLVVLDYLMRNTDRGLDNFMVKHDQATDQVTIGAIDNSLSFPIKHPNEIRQYPFGWLFLPTDLIGLPFSQPTRSHLLPILDDPVWWQQTVQGLREIFQRDPYFANDKFERQMSVLRGQGWNLVQSLRNEEEGPLDLCAREKKFIRQKIVNVPTADLRVVDGVKVPIDSQGQIIVNSLPLSDQPTSSMKGALRSTSPAYTSQTITLEQIAKRPIGARASQSYRQALRQAAGPVNTAQAAKPIASVVSSRPKTEQNVLPQSLPGSSSMQTTFAPGSDPPQVYDVVQRPYRHSRMSSALEPRSLMNRQHSDPIIEDDDILGQTGMQVLERLDRERKQEARLGLFRTSRPRSSTVTATAELTDSSGSGDAIVVPAEMTAVEAIDLASSIVSDPGHSSVTATFQQRGRVSRHTSGGRMSSSTQDVSREDDVLSEEDEDDNAQDRRLDRPGPSIDVVLASATQSSGLNSAASGENGMRFTPHIPHAGAIPTASHHTDDSNSAFQSTRRKQDTVRVILEVMSSETRQPWLTWM